MPRLIRASILVDAGQLFSDLGRRAAATKDPVRVKLNAVSHGISVKGVFRVVGYESVAGHTGILFLARKRKGELVCKLDWNRDTILNIEVMGPRRSAKRAASKVVSTDAPERRRYLKAVA